MARHSLVLQLLLDEGDDSGADPVSALKRSKVATTVNEIELRLRDEAMDGLGLIWRRDPVERAPDDENRHVELRQQIIGHVLSR